MILSDLTGQRFGRLVAIKQAPSHKGAVRWECQCDCGNSKIISAASLRDGTQSCGCYRKEFRRLNGNTAALNKAFSNYARTAARKGYIFELTLEQFQALTQTACTYCGFAPDIVSLPSHFTGDTNTTYVRNGIDRVNNSIGYIISNCVPCCQNCNYAKRNMTEGEFLDWIRRVAKHQANRITVKSTGFLIDEMYTAEIKSLLGNEEATERRHELGNAVMERMAILVTDLPKYREFQKLMAQLKSTLQECFDAQEVIRYLPDADKCTVEQAYAGAKASDTAQRTNAQRNALIRELDKIIGEVDRSQLLKTYKDKYDS